MANKDINIFQEYLDEIKQVELLSREEEKRLANLACHGDIEARNKLVLANQRLVINIASKYLGRGLDYLDLIQEGNMGLMEAANNFNPHRGFKFATYATWWIKHMITRAIMYKAKNIKVPVHLYEFYCTYNKVYEKLMYELSREPSLKEVAAYLSVSPEKITKMLIIINNTISLNSFVFEENEIGDFIVDPEIKIEETVIQKILDEEFEQSLPTILTAREIEMLQLRFGFEGKKPYKYEEIGAHYQISRQRAYQLVERSLKKLCTLPAVKERLQLQGTLIQFNEFTENEEKRQMKKHKKLFEYFQDYSETDVKDAIKRLDVGHQECLIQLFGSKFDRINLTYIDNPDLKQKLKNVILPKIKRILMKNNPKNADLQTIRKLISDNNLEKILFQKSSKHPEILPKEILLEIFYYLKSKEYLEMATYLSNVEAIIIALYSGLINNHTFTIEQISNILDISTVIVEQIIKNNILNESNEITKQLVKTLVWK